MNACDSKACVNKKINNVAYRYSGTTNTAGALNKTWQVSSHTVTYLTLCQQLDILVTYSEMYPDTKNHNVPRHKEP